MEELLNSYSIGKKKQIMSIEWAMNEQKKEINLF